MFFKYVKDKYQITSENSVHVLGSFSKFVEVYEKNLRLALKEKPNEYAWPESDLPKVLERMKTAIKNGSFNKDGYAFKKTCKELGIKHTYTEIKKYIEQSDTVE